MTVSFVAFSDVHAHPFSYGAKKVNLPGYKGAYNSRLVDTLNVLDEVFEYAIAVNADFMLFGGDMFHKRTSVRTETMYLVKDKIKEKMAKFGKPLIMIPGNHDMPTRNGDVHSLSLFSDMTNVYVQDDETGMFTVAGKATIYTVPYIDSLVHARERLAAANELAAMSVTGHKILLAHLGIQGGKVGSDYVLVNDSDVCADDVSHSEYDISLFGHFHEQQLLFDAGMYIGASHEHNWGDSAGRRGYLHITLKEGTKPEVKHLQTSAPKFIKHTFGDTPQWSTKDFVKVSCDRILTEAEVSALPPAAALEIIPITNNNLEITELSAEKLNPDTIIEEWVTANATHYDEDTQALILSIGKKELAEAKGRAS